MERPAPRAAAASAGRRAARWVAIAAAVAAFLALQIAIVGMSAAAGALWLRPERWLLDTEAFY